MACFDRYIAVDWSAAARPVTGSDSIWIADRARSGRVDCVNPSTRAAAWAYLDDAVESANRSGDRLLVGVDVSLGYPRGTASLFGLDEALPWRAMWAALATLVTDDDGNRNNRFVAAADLNRRVDGSGPFWGCPHDRLAPDLEPTKPTSFAVPEFRAVEERLRTAGRRPHSVWQLLGAGSVGSQSMTAIPGWFERLDRVDVWPFTTGFDDAPSARGVVVAELWPSLFEYEEGPVRDRQQVLAAVEAVRDADERGILSRWLRTDNDDADRRSALAEEGWILGVS